MSTARAHAPEGSKGDIGKCPVNHETRSAFLEAAKKEKAADAQPPAAADAATPAERDVPMATAAKAEREVYNVYSQRINPDNMMPMQPNQLPVAGQDAPLPQVSCCCRECCARVLAGVGLVAYVTIASHLFLHSLVCNLRFPRAARTACGPIHRRSSSTTRWCARTRKATISLRKTSN